MPSGVGNPGFCHNEEICKITVEAQQLPSTTTTDATDIVLKPAEGQPSAKKPPDITYGIDDAPPWYMCALLGMQHYMTMIGGTITLPFLLTPLMCIADDNPVRGKFVSSLLFVSGIVTFIQTTFGVRLPIIQGGTFAFLLPTFAILKTAYPACDSYNFSNMTTEEKDEVWMVRMREVQGAIIVSSLFQVLIGFSGIIGFLLRWITPLSVVPTICLIGFSLFGPAADKSSGNWGIASMTAAFIILFSQYLGKFKLPLPTYQRGKGVVWSRFEIFNLFPVIVALVLSWGICGILTASGSLEEGSKARTDLRLSIVAKSPWFYVPYPFQWGIPTVSFSAVVGVLTGVFASIIESIGDYYACARLSGVEPPPRHAINRGIGVEGIGCVIAGIIGTGSGTTSYSENIGAIRITKVASRRVIQTGAFFMILFGVFGKFGASFVTLPDPVVGGVFLVLFAIITAIGLSNLQIVDLNSSRNLFVLGFSLFIGLAVPEWMKKNENVINTGYPLADQVITVLLSTTMFVGAAVGMFFDNTIPGTKEERGLHLWNAQLDKCDDSTSSKTSSYDLPFGMDRIRRIPWCAKIPFSPTYISKSKQQTPIYTRIKAKFFCEKAQARVV